MRKFLLLLLWAGLATATPKNFYEMKHPVMPEPVPPQQLTFPALSTNNAFTGFNSFQGAYFGLPIQLAVQACPVVAPPTGIDSLYACASDLNLYYQDSTGRVVGPLGSGGGGGGGGGGATISTNGINNTNQTILNFQNSGMNAAGLAVSFSNPSGGNESAEVSGTVNVASGGSGRSSPTANAVLLAEGPSPYNLLLPGPVGTVLTSNGPGADPTYQTASSGTSNFPLTVANGVSGGIPYFSNATTESASALLAVGQFVLGGGAGNPPTTAFSTVPSSNGGTGVAAPPAHQIPVAEGANPFSFITPGTPGWCFLSNGTAADPSFGACPTATPAGSTFAIQYNAGGGAFGGLAGGTTNGVYNVIKNITGGADVAPTMALPGVLTNAQTGTSYTYGTAFTNADRFGYTTFSNAGTVTATLPQAGSTGFTSNWGNISCNIGAGQVNINPQTSTISYTTFQTYVSGASTMPLTTGQCAWIFSNNSNYFALVQGGVTSIVKGTAILGTASITNGTCALVTVAAPGVTTANVIDWGLSADISGTTGYTPVTSGGLQIEAYPGANNVNFKNCNPTAAPIIPGSAVTLNWSVRIP